MKIADYQVQLEPKTACLMFKDGNKLLDYMFYNKFGFDSEDVTDEAIQEDSQTMVNKHLRVLIFSMIDEYRKSDSFTSDQLERISQLADFTSHDVRKKINSFYYINTHITSNGGIPILKEILTLI